jgi:hypothetical protein
MDKISLLLICVSHNKLATVSPSLSLSIDLKKYIMTEFMKRFGQPEYFQLLAIAISK